MLNPDAPAFVPASWSDMTMSEPTWDESDFGEMTEEELAELEATEEWVSLMVDLDEAEKEHLIAYALEHAPAAAFVLEEEVLGNKSRSPNKSKGARKGQKASQ